MNLNHSAFVLFGLLALMPFTAGQADAQMTPGQIRAIQVVGDVFQRATPGGNRTVLRRDAILAQGATVETGANGNASLLFENGSVISIGPNSRFSIEKFLTDPFDAQNVDYRRIKQEPSRSETRLKQDKGTLVFNVRKQRRGSSYDVVTPVGTAGIRGTLGVIWETPESTPDNPSYGVGVDNGRVDWTTPEGETQSLGGGDTVGVGGPAGNVQFTDPPANSDVMLDMAGDMGGIQEQQIPDEPFSPPPADQQPQAATGDSPISPENMRILEAAATKGNQALMDAILELIERVGEEEAAAIIAFAAANLGDDPTMVPQLSNLGTKVLKWLAQPGDRVETGQIIAIISVGGVEMEYRATAAGILYRQLVPENQVSNAEVIALITVDAADLMPALVAAAAFRNPNAAAAMAAAAAAAFPGLASQIALAASIAAPTQALQIAQQIINNVPQINQTAVLNSALDGAGGIGPEDISMTTQLLLSHTESEQQVFEAANQAMGGGEANVGNPFATTGAIDTPENPGGILDPFPEATPTPSPSPTATPAPTPDPPVS